MLTGVSTTVSTTSASELKPDNDVLNNQMSDLCDNQNTHNEPSERKRKNLHAVKSTNDTSPKRKRNKKRQTTIDELQYQNGSKSIDQCTGEKAGALYSRTFMNFCPHISKPNKIVICCRFVRSIFML